MSIIERILIVLVVLPIFFLFMRHDIKKYLKSEREKELIKKQTSVQQKKENDAKQLKKHNLFMSLSIVGCILILFLKNTFIGFFIGFGLSIPINTIPIQSTL